MASPALLTLSFVLLFIFPTIFGYRLDEVKSWCSKTPNPQPCEYLLSLNPDQTPIKDESDFYKISLQLALESAKSAQSHTYSLGPKVRNEREKVSWEDCVKLYELTTLKLNQTMDLSTKSTQADKQTWLSTALTNSETCPSGFIELGVTDNVLPLMSNNVSKLVSNSLFLNKDVPFSEPSHKDGFPTWVKPGDRKLLHTPSPASHANVVVAQDGSGNYKTINEAITAASKWSGSGRYVIYIKSGIYVENVEVGEKLKNIMFAGDGIGKTIVTGNKSNGGGSSTFNSATVAIVGAGFIARGMTFQNTAGPQNNQAVALRSGSDMSVFYNCSFEGYQDTLYVHSERQFYRECDIYGTVDFIFGNAAVVLQSCSIYPRYPPYRYNYLTAQSRTNPNQNTGIIIHNSRVTAAPDLKPVQRLVNTYLGRPWGEYSRTVYMKTYLDSLINPDGWTEWDGDFALKTLYYAEYNNSGPGSNTTDRVKWAGHHVLTTVSEASNFTVHNFLDGDSWLPATKVPYTSGL